MSVCTQHDLGGSSTFSQQWCSYLKVRLQCDIPGDMPFYFDEVRKYKLCGPYYSTGHKHFPIYFNPCNSEFTIVIGKWEKDSIIIKIVPWWFPWLFNVLKCFICAITHHWRCHCWWNSSIKWIDDSLVFTNNTPRQVIGTSFLFYYRLTLRLTTIKKIIVIRWRWFCYNLHFVLCVHCRYNVSGFTEHTLFVL